MSHINRSEEEYESIKNAIIMKEMYLQGIKDGFNLKKELKEKQGE